jgi:hypothetical protein
LNLGLKYSFNLFIFIQKVDTRNIDGFIRVEIKLNDKNVNFEILRSADKKFEFKFLPDENGIYHVYIYLNEKSIKGKGKKKIKTFNA